MLGVREDRSQPSIKVSSKMEKSKADLSMKSSNRVDFSFNTVLYTRKKSMFGGLKEKADSTLQILAL